MFAYSKNGYTTGLLLVLANCMQWRIQAPTAYKGVGKYRLLGVFLTFFTVILFLSFSHNTTLSYFSVNNSLLFPQFFPLSFHFFLFYFHFIPNLFLIFPKIHSFLFLHLSLLFHLYHKFIINII